MTTTPEKVQELLDNITPGEWKFVIDEDDKYDLGKFVSSSGENICSFGNDELYYPSEGEAPAPQETKLIELTPEIARAYLKECEKNKMLETDNSRLQTIIDGLNQQNGFHGQVEFLTILCQGQLLNLQEIRRKNSILEDALRFYAEEMNYDEKNAPYRLTSDDIKYDKGEEAREALEKIKTL